MGKSFGKKILWCVTDFVVGSGGHRTVLQNAIALMEAGYSCDFLMSETNKSPEEIRVLLDEAYDIKFGGDIISEKGLKKKYDAVIATEWSTVKIVSKIRCANKVYFIQDWEPWFFPRGELNIDADDSYRHGLVGVTIGNWLPTKLMREYGISSNRFSFCADLDLYKREEGIEKEDAVCFVYQPNKPRRCAELGLRALQIVQEIRPETKIYLYGSPKMVPYNINAEHLGMLSVEDCNKLYNKCKVGLCLSSTNPSRIPFEMMATGLPVVDLYLENNLFDLPDDGCFLADPSPESIAATIIELLEKERLSRQLSRGGEEYMRKYPLEKGFNEFVEIINEIVAGKAMKNCRSQQIYKRTAKKTLPISQRRMPGVYFRTVEDVEREKEEQQKAKEEEEWRRNLTFWQRVYLKVRYILLRR